MADENMLDALAESESESGDSGTNNAAAPAPVVDIGESLGAAFLNQSESRDGAILDVNIDVVAVLGTADLKVSQILQLGRGAVVELDRLIGEPVDLRAERQLIAKGEVVVVEDRLAIQLTEVIKN
ncbi:MAG: FliM/FliN family flagellar motor switch protein [Rhodospirillales bacterium]|nr:FliM/FliN family flagellar motor switch protein [Rhodospirillales bacterium]MDP6642600.1 FliM/FliN family flagellar motor switch protein [Rhodospirillales bacterium]MDP6843740.1 FliM/FliN family flagellar motor switch protein [Rhodospirillales bacterium]